MTRAAALLAVALLTATAPLDVVVLKPGATIERELSGSDRHEYDLPLQAGDSVALTIQQRGTDVLARILDEAGATVALIDDEVSKDGQEHVALVADATRAYRLVIAARYPKLALGGYAIRVDGVHPASAIDRDAYQARKLGSEAVTLRGAGKFDDALDRASRALALAEPSLGADAPYLASLLTTLAGVQRAKGRLKEAEQSFLRAIAIAESRLGPAHPQTGAIKETLGVMYNAMDEPAKAEPLMVEGTSITERALGDHPRLATCLMDLALFHNNRGDAERAMAELQRAMQVSDKTMSPDEFAAIAIVNNLGDLYVSMKDYDRAQPLVERAVRDLERTLGADNYRVATPLLNLSIIARERSDYVGALQHLRRAYALREKAFGKEHTDTASLLITIGNVYHAQKDYPAALGAYQQALDVLEQTAGPFHNLTLMAINNAARTLAASGDVAGAVERRARFETLLDRAIGFNLAIGSDREKLAYLAQTFERMGRTISLHLRQAPTSQAAADLAASAILRRKGRVLDAALDSRATLRARLEPSDQRMLDDLSTITAQLSALALNGPGRTPVAEFRDKLAGLDRQREALESGISRRSAPYRAETHEATLDEVRAAVPERAALVEYVVYEPFDPLAATDAAAHGDSRYAAYVIHRTGAVRGVDLGPAKIVEAAVARLREALRDPRRRDVETLGRTVDGLVFRPVRALTGTASQLLIAPDGVLNLVPFEALVDERGRFQVERYAISYLAGGRDLLRMQVRSASAGSPLLIADPAFGDAPADAASTYFAPLAGSAREVEAIGRVLPRATVLTGSRATKSALQNAAAPSILHVATHAFFVDQSVAAAAAGGTRASPVTSQARDPLLRSGIALAGANVPRQGERGILTGLEASTLNLWGTRLVTLSACDTGVGEIRNGEGVYGLRRAFALAGAETLVMSLWPVSDYVTRSVMTDYYAGLARGLGREAALRRVQLAMVADPQRRHPFYWAAFIQAGDWRPISTTR